MKAPVETITAILQSEPGQQARLRIVEARIEFFGSEQLRRHYSGLLRELNDERRRLRVQLERAFNHLPPRAR